MLIGYISKNNVYDMQIVYINDIKNIKNILFRYSIH